jgi:hypothetical protein
MLIHEMGAVAFPKNDLFLNSNVINTHKNSFAEKSNLDDTSELYVTTSHDYEIKFAIQHFDA